MVARYTGATLALFAFAVSITGGLFAQNPPMVILSRAVLALFVFLFIGLLLGSCAQMVIREHRTRHEEEIRRRFGETPEASTDGGDRSTPAAKAAEPARA